MVIELLSQIDIDHWTVRFVDGQWQDKVGDYRIEHQNYDVGQHLEVEPVGNIKEPTRTRYCGKLDVKGVVEVKPTKKKGKVVIAPGTP